MNNSQKVLVTGATGLVGVHICVDLIQRGYTNIVGLYRSEDALKLSEKVADHYGVKEEFKSLQWVKFDLMSSVWNETLFTNVDVILHTAAMVSFDPEENQKMDILNVGVTDRLLDCAKKSNIGKFGFLSSVASLGRRSGNSVYSEDNQWLDSDLNSYYSITKHNAEQLVINANDKDLQTYIINPGVILGPGDWNKSSGTIFRTGKKGLSFYTSGGNGFVDVRDVAHNLMQVLEFGIPAERYLVVGHNVKFKKLFSDIQLKFGNKAPRFRAGSWLTGVGWRIEKLRSKLGKRSPVLTKHSASASHNVNVYSNDKIGQLEGVFFTDWIDTIENTVSYFKSDNKE